MNTYNRNRLEEDGWTDLEMVYTAANFGLFLCPFQIDIQGDGQYFEFEFYYRRYSGILVGKRKDIFKGNPGHAIAKVGDVLIDPLDGKSHPLFGEAFNSLYNRIFFAKVT